MFAYTYKSSYPYLYIYAYCVFYLTCSTLVDYFLCVLPNVSCPLLTHFLCVDEEKVGPIVLASLLALSVLVNFAVKIYDYAT